MINLTKQLAGVTPAMSTPLLDYDQVNLPVVADLVEFLIARGVAGIFVGGTTGEGILLPLTERQKLHETAVRAVNGRVPVLVHAGTGNTPDTIRLAQHAAEIGADAVVIIPPVFFGIEDDVIVDYMLTVAETIPDMPVLVYDIPHLAINGISPFVAKSLMATMPNFAGIKCSRPDAQMIRKLIDTTDKKVAVLVGNEAIALGSLAMGATGLISGLATAVPEPFVALTKAVADNDLATAQDWQNRINRALACFPAGMRLGGVKSILQARGIAVGNTIPPRPMPTTTDLWQQIAEIIERI